MSDRSLKFHKRLAVTPCRGGGGQITRPGSAFGASQPSKPWTLSGTLPTVNTQALSKLQIITRSANPGVRSRTSR